MCRMRSKTAFTIMEFITTNSGVRVTLYRRPIKVCLEDKIDTSFAVRPDLLNFLLLEPGRSKFFRFHKKIKLVLTIELMHVCT